MTDHELAEPKPEAAIPKMLKRRVVRWLAIGVTLYAAACALLVFLEPRLVFPGAYFEKPYRLDPKRFMPELPKSDEIRDFVAMAEDESQLIGRILVRPDAKRVILFLHGNGIHAIEMDGWTQRLSDTLEATVLTAEYRGFMSDAFRPTEASVIADGVSSLDALSEFTGTPTDQIVVYGRSLGGGVAAGVVAETMRRGTATKSLVLDRTFDSTLHIGQDRFFFLPVTLLMRHRFQSDRRLAEYSGNVIQLHGPEDAIVPMKYGRALFESLSTPHKVWIEVPGMRHNDREPLEVLQRVDRELTTFGS